VLSRPNQFLLSSGSSSFAHLTLWAQLNTFEPVATIQLRTRIDSELKRKGDAVLKKLGLDASTFVSLSLAQLVNRRGLPFAVTESDADYFSKEYEISSAQAARVGRKLRVETSRARRSGKLKEVTSAADLSP
jgi:addiction module RelB/DinJ family antitoxin